LVNEWLTNDDVSHGLFVPLAAAWIVWQKKTELLQTPTKPSKLGFALLIFGGIFVCIGPPDLQTFAFLTRLAFLVSLVGLLLAVCGWPIVKQLTYPLILLVLMIPLPGFVYSRITLPLQLLASQIAEIGLEVIGYSVLREGNIIHLPRQTLEVVEACSGLRSLLSLLFLSQVYIYLFDTRPWMRVVAVGMIVPIAIAANAGRIILTAVLSQVDQAWGHGILHAFTAWGIFVIAFGLLLATHWLWNLVGNMFVYRTASRKVT